jgi:hypothetical protein
MRALRPFWTWFLQALLGLAGISLLLYYGLFHLGVGVPLRALLGPWLSVSVLVVGLLPFFYWCAQHARRSGGDVRPLFALSGATAMLACLIIFYYAYRLALLSSESARGACIATLIAVPPCTALAYYFNRKLFPNLFR